MLPRDGVVETRLSTNLKKKTTLNEGTSSNCVPSRATLCVTVNKRVAWNPDLFQIAAG